MTATELILLILGAGIFWHIMLNLRRLYSIILNKDKSDFACSKDERRTCMKERQALIVKNVEKHRQLIADAERWLWAHPR